MIDLYTWATPNGHKVHILLEECGLHYRVHPVHIGRGEQFAPEFLTISPNNRAHGIEKQGHDPSRYPNVVRWWERVRERPAVRRGVKVLSDTRRLEMNANEREVLFGSRQHA